jgi:hypothetical protein
MGKFVQSFAVSQFHKFCPLPEEQKALTQQENILRNIRTIKVSLDNISWISEFIAALLCMGQPPIWVAFTAAEI